MTMSLSDVQASAVSILSTLKPHVTPSSQTRRSLALTFSVWAAIAAIFALVFLVLLPQGVWKNYDGAGCRGQCENWNMCNHTMAERPIIQQPVNTWTNFSFILASLWPVIGIRQDISTVVFLLAEMYVGVSSFVFHASITKTWQHLDAAATKSNLCTLVLHGVYAASGGRVEWKTLAPINFVVALVFFLWKKEIDEEIGSKNFWVFYVTVLIFFVSFLMGVHIKEILNPIKKKKEVDCAVETTTNKNAIQIQSTTSDSTAKFISVLKVVVLAIAPGVFLGWAVVLNFRDRDKTICVPDSVFQKHGGWHILNATASLWLWMFFDYHVVPVDQNQHMALGQGDDDVEDATSQQFCPEVDVRRMMQPGGEGRKRVRRLSITSETVAT